MPSLLEEAILDAKLLREAALKTAENKIIEQYAEQVRSAMNTLLEQTEGDDPITTPEPAQTEEEVSGESSKVKIPESALGEKIMKAIEETGEKDEDGEDIVELDLNALKEMAEVDEMLSDEGEVEEEQETHEEMAEDILEEELEEEELEEEVLQEELVVDITDGDFTGWAGRPEHDRQRQQKINLARLADTKQKEEFAKLQQGMKDLAGITENLKKDKARLSEQNKTLLETIEALKERLEDTALLNSKLLYQNKVLTNESLNARQKNSIVESIQKANTTSDAKVIYETLQSAASAGSVGSSRKESLHEAINRPSHTITRRTTNNDSLLNEMTDRFQLLAGIKRH
jgi:hypothetical protein